METRDPATGTGVLWRWVRGHRKDFAALAPVLALTCAYFAPLLLSRDVIYGGLDITRQFYLFKLHAVTAVQRGELPLWLPEIYCGMPLLGALIDTPFHPWDLTAALLNLPLPVIFNVGLLLHLVIGQVGAYVWVRQDSLRRLPALLASLWIWNPFILNSIVSGDHNNIRAMLLVPAILAALERGLDRGRFHSAWLCYGLLQALQILCSGLQFAFYTCAFGGLTTLGTLLHRRGREPNSTLAARMRWWIMGTFLALALPMIQLLPGLEYGGYSVRGAANIVWSTMWGIKPGWLLSYVAPFVYRNREILVYWGLAPMWFAGIGMLTWRHPRRWWYVTTLIVSLILCIGAEWSVSGWLNSLPILRGFRGPFRIALFANLMLVRLAAGGVSATMERIERNRHPIRWNIACRRSAGVVLLLMATALFWWPLKGEAGSDAEMVAELLPTAVMWAITIAGVAVLLRWRTTMSLYLLLTIAVADIALHVTPIWKPQPTTPFKPDATVDALHDWNPGERAWLRATPYANYLGLFGIPSVAGHHAFPLARAARFVGALDIHDSRLLRLTQTTHIFTYRRPSSGPIGPPIHRASEVEVRKLAQQPIPYFSVQAKVRFVASGEEAWSLMQDADWNPDTSALLIEGKQPPVPVRGGTATHDIDVQENTAQRKHLIVTTNAPAYLVIAETWYPGWTASVNGNPARLYRANYLFQAVALPQGESEVLLTFRPVTVRAGGMSSAVGILAFVIAIGVARRRDRLGVA